MATAALAAACVPGSYLWAEPQFGPPGGTVTINGKEFESGSVEIRWGSASGPVLAIASSTSFAQSVTIPTSAAEGIYLVFAVASNGELNRTPIEVTNASSPGPWGDGGWAQRPTDPGARTPPPAANAAPGAVPDAVNAAPSPSPAAAPKAPAAGAPARENGAGRGLPTAPRRDAAARARDGARAELDLPANRTSGRPGGGHGLAPERGSGVADPTSAQAGIEGRRPSERGALPSERSALEGLWSGFDGDDPPSLGRSSLASEGGPRGRLTIALGLLGLGLTALLGGLATARTRRRGAVARRSPDN